MSNLFRVRDKNTAKGMGTVWGEDLSFADADAMCKSLLGSNKSMTARVVSMDEDGAAVRAPTPAPAPMKDPYLLQSRARAASAAAPAAQAAQQRHEQLMAKKKQQEAIANLPPPEVPDFDEGDLDGDDEVDGDAANLALDAT